MTGERNSAPVTECEEALDPAQPIVDAHHHLYDRPEVRYLREELLADIRAGHNIIATVFVQALAMYRKEGPDELRPVGETEFARDIALSCQRGEPRLCAGIVGYADLTLGANVRPVLEAHIAAGDGRFRGIRHIACWDQDTMLLNPAYPTSEDLLDSVRFRAGFEELASLGLSFDAWLYYPQMSRLAALARAFPDTRIVLNHCGGVLGRRFYSNRREEIFMAWSVALREVSRCHNICVKLGGLGMAISGFGFDGRHPPASSWELAAAWRPWFETAIDCFGVDRCMFESNSPADRASYSYATGWNAMKRIAAGASRDERAELFSRSATRFYRLAV
jgi:L-fuconolactonase